jgi:FdhD protein
MTKTAGTVKLKNFETRIQSVLMDGLPESKTDVLAAEEPLEIRLGFSKNGKTAHRAVSITMRTPGDDFALAAGFLFTEGILKTKEQIRSIKHCGRFPSNRNTVRVDLADGAQIDLDKLQRNFYTTSSCGVCGKSSLEALTVAGAAALEPESGPRIPARVIYKLPEKLLKNQTVFNATGGLHAAALFDAAGELLDLREDVGRHNAVDKLIGARFLDGALPLEDKILFLSGRAGFELVQKAVMARIPFVAAVGAPSSLAVEAAREFNMTLLGFVRDERFNIYTGGRRIAGLGSEI